MLLMFLIVSAAIADAQGATRGGQTEIRRPCQKAQQKRPAKKAEPRCPQKHESKKRPHHRKRQLPIYEVPPSEPFLPPPK